MFGQDGKEGESDMLYAYQYSPTLPEQNQEVSPYGYDLEGQPFLIANEV